MAEKEPVSNPKAESGPVSNKSEISRKFESLESILLRRVSIDGMNLRRMAISLNRSPSTINYHLKRLKTAGLINCDQSYPFAVYSLTPLGEQILKSSYDTRNCPLWRCHARIIGNRIKDWGSFDYTKRRKISMNNWSYVIAPVRYKDKTWNIHIQKNGLAKVFCPPVYCDKPDTAFAQMTETAVRLFDRLAAFYGMQFGPVFTVREGHKELIGSEMFAKLFGKIKAGNVWIDASEGTDCLEETATENKLEQMLALPDAVLALSKIAQEQSTIMSQFCEQIRLHLDVITKLGTAMDKMNLTLDKIQESLDVKK